MHVSICLLVYYCVCVGIAMAGTRGMAMVIAMAIADSMHVRID